MIERDGDTVRAIAWSEVFPWLSILRVFRLAIAARALLLGAVGILVMETGWGVIGHVLGTDSDATAWLQPFAHCSWESATGAVPDKPTAAFSILGFDSGETDPSQNDGSNPKEPMRSSWALLSLPAWAALGNANLPMRDAAALLLCGLLGVAVWAFFGMAICRMAAVQLAAEEQVGWGPALRYACRKWPACCAAPLLPVGGVLLATIPVCGVGVDHEGQCRAAVGRAAVAVGAGGRLVDDLAAVGPAVRLAVDVGHDQRRRDRQLRRPEPLLRLRVPAAAALPVLRRGGRL